MPDNHASDELATLQTMARLQSQVCYMNVDRSLATWTRTALSLIVFGLVVDRFGLLLTQAHLSHVGTRLAPNPLSSLGGIILVAFGVFIAAAAAIRHQGYRANWNRVYHPPAHPHGPYLAFVFAVLVAIFGVAILAVLLTLVW